MTLASILWLVTLKPNAFPKLPFQAGHEMPGIAQKAIAQHEIENIVKRHVSNACQRQYNEDFHDFEWRQRQTSNEAASSIWAAFSRGDLNSSMLPNKPDIFNDVTRSVGLTFSSRSASCASGSADAWTEIEKLYRQRSLAIGLENFLKQVAEAATLVRPHVQRAQVADDAPLTQSVEDLPEPDMHPLQDPGPCQVCREQVEATEKYVASLLKHFHVSKDSAGVQHPTFPLNCFAFKTTVASEMYKEFVDSWNFHHSQHDRIDDAPQEFPVAMNGALQNLADEVSGYRKSLESYLLKAVQALPNNAEGIRLKALRWAHLAPTATFSEIFKQALPERRDWTIFNPFLTDSGIACVLQAVLCLLQVSVLEAKVQRLNAWKQAGTGALSFMIQELKVTRKWCIDDHPAWLVFEAEQMLQIRPAQYDVALHLIENPGEVIQLNMGEGKTRVIVPMLLLHWASAAARDVVRVNVLTPLLGEMYEYLHRILGGLLGRRVYILPFHRQVRISAQRLELIEKQMLQCRTEQGVLLTAPEHRLSMQLKLHELHMKEFSQEGDGLWRALAKVLRLPMCELLDESDEILRHKYQLIYAVGSMLPLAEGKSRWEVCQLLLRCFQQDEKICSWLQERKDAALCRKAEPEAFQPLRLLASKQLDDLMPDLNRHLCDLAFKGQFYEFAFMKKWASEKSLRDFATNPSKGEADVPLDAREDMQLWPVLLAIRGLLACGVLQHALMKRHRVDYGINPNGKKRLAVPFRGKDTPSERSEFGHPDMALVLTHLSYYEDGLSEDDVRKAFVKLLAGGPNERKDLYNIWLMRSKTRMPEAVFEHLSNVDKIDTSNEEQVKELSVYFSKNMETINFWLTQCVFPSETTQFPQRLVANAWHLAEGDHVHGFSGTKDNHLVLPFQLTQRTLDDLRGTDGKMMQILLTNPEYIEVPNDWKSVLEMSAKYQVLIDAGALMTGVDNLGAAKHALNLRRDLPGVVFFDERRRHGQWSVIDRFGRIMPQQKSAVRPRDCFAYYDQSRARGSDLKLDQRAKACVTLGTSMCKDALMQACGRMRMLDRGQKLLFLGTAEVSQKIRASCHCKEITSKEILQWVLQNSVSAMDDALVEWARQGTSFAITRDCSQMLLQCEEPQETVAKVCAQDEILLLEDLYRFPLQLQSGADVVSKHIKADLERTEFHLQGLAEDNRSSIIKGMRSITECIAEKTERFCQETLIMANGLDEEYERELEKQVEQEHERELPEPQTAKEEVDWDWKAVLQREFLESCKSPAGPVRLVRLEEILGRTHRLRRLSVQFPKCLWASSNFVEVLASPEQKLDDYVRLVDAMLTFDDTEVILISTREADHLLPIFRQASAQRGGVQLQHFGMVKAGKKALALPHRSHADAFNPPPRRPPILSPLPISPNLVAILQLFMGECTYGPTELEELRAFLHLGAVKAGSSKTVAVGSAAQGRRLAELLVALRGKLHLFTRSDLDKILMEMVP